MIIVIITSILSIIIAAIVTTIHSINKQNTEDKLDTFLYSFLGGLTGGFTEIIVSFILGHIIIMLTPSTGSIFIYGSLNNVISVIVVFLICWVSGTLCGGIITIKPLIKLFSDN